MMDLNSNERIDQKLSQLFETDWDIVPALSLEQLVQRVLANVGLYVLRLSVLTLVVCR